MDGHSLAHPGLAGLNTTLVLGNLYIFLHLVELNAISHV